MKRRHSGHHMGNGGGHMGAGNGQQRRPQGRYGHSNNNGGFQKPRKNFPALREKYLNMAKDAMSSGDRVLAEYYLQHADHYYRMQAEFQAERAARQPQGTPMEEGQQQQQDENDSGEGGTDEQEIDSAITGNVLPAFLTRQVQQQPQSPESEGGKVAASGWEED